jgi:hypothetical protein
MPILVGSHRLLNELAKVLALQNKIAALVNIPLGHFRRITSTMRYTRAPGGFQASGYGAASAQYGYGCDVQRRGHLSL